MENICPYIRKGKFIGSFEVVCCSEEIIPCCNIATARAIKKKLIDNNANEKSWLDVSIDNNDQLYDL